MIDKESVIFLDGALNAFSMLIDATITIINIEAANESCECDFLKFYDFLKSDSIVSISDFNFYDLEKVFKEQLFKTSTTINIAKQREEYIAYKLMDYLIFCFKDDNELESDGLEHTRWAVTKIEFDYKDALSFSFIFSNPKAKERVVLTFWNIDV